MNMIDDGTSAIVVTRTVPLRRKDYRLPSFAPPMGDRDHLLVVVGEDKHVGRAGAVNLLASTIGLTGRSPVIIELATIAGAAIRAHKALVPTHLVIPGAPRWHTMLIDHVAEHAGETVILTVPAAHWTDFVRLEAALVDSVRGLRPLAYLFIDPTAAAKKLNKHLDWLKASGLPAFVHRLGVRELPLYPPAKPPTPGYHSTILIPFFEAQVADAMFGRDTVPTGSPHFATFAAAWDRATTGTKAVMWQGLEAALNGIAEWLDQATHQREQEG